MPPNQLDLSKFSKIVPQSSESKEEELLQRQKGLESIQAIMENLTNALASYVKDLQSINGNMSLLRQMEEALRAREYDLSQQKKVLDQEKSEIEKEKEYVEASLKERDLQHLEDESFLKKINEAKEEVDKRREAADKQEAVIKEKLKVLDSLEKDRQELEEKEAALAKSSQIDVERKRLLDVREARIKNHEKRIGLEQQE